MKSALFVQTNVAVNTKLTSKVPFLFGNFQVFFLNLVKNVQFRYGMTGMKIFLGALFNIPKCPWNPVPPPPNLLMLPTPLPKAQSIIQHTFYLFDCLSVIGKIFCLFLKIFPRDVFNHVYYLFFT
jgi:hypothetical protein